MFFDSMAETISVSEITYNGKKLVPERIMRNVHVHYRDFLKFHKCLEEILSLFNDWQTHLRYSIIVKGGWVIPKAPLMLAQQTVDSLKNYSRWLWPLPNGWVLCCLFTQNKVNDVKLTTTETEYIGMCTMDVEIITLTS